MKTKDINLNDCKSFNEVLEKTGCNFTTRLEDTITYSGLEVPRRKAVVREDSNIVLGSVGSRYTLINNQNAFAFFDGLVSESKARYQNYKEFDNGRRCTLTARYGDSIDIKTGDPVYNLIHMNNGFDGGLSCLYNLSSFREVCSNGMKITLNKSVYSVRHTKNFQVRMEEIYKTLGYTDKVFNEFIIKCKGMTEQAMDRLQVDTFLNNLLDVVNPEEITSSQIKKKDRILNLSIDGVGQNDQTELTGWDLYNGVTEYYTHEHGSDKAREHSNIFGSAGRIKEKAFNLLTKD